MVIYKLEPALSNVSISLSVYENVKNVPEIKKLIENGNMNAAVLKSDLILDEFQLLVAINKAFFLNSKGKLKTRNVFSEILFNLSPSSKISECFKVFGIDESTTNLIVICMEDKYDDIDKVVDGSSVDLSNLGLNCNKEAIMKLYKINESELKVSSLLDCVVSQLAAKDIR